MTWRDRPSKIKNWSGNIDYAMFIDENGTENKLETIFKAVIHGKKIDENDRYFTVTGCIFKKSDYKKAVDNIDFLKNKYWTGGVYHDLRHNQDKYVCFHSREIRRHDGAFSDSIINHKNFVNDLTNVLKNTNCVIISVTIDLLEYLIDGYLDNVYEKAFDLLLERYIYATGNNKKGIIMLEARGKKEDKDLLKHITKVIDEGTRGIKSEELKNKNVGIYFNPKWTEKYSHTFTGLEIVDLFSYPIHQYIKYNKSNPAFEVLKHKIDKYPNFINKGIKVFPTKNKRQH